MVEGMVLALDGVLDRSFTGNLTAYHVGRIAELADRHGFEPGEHTTHTLRGVTHATA
jgi:hypothetical protein